MSLLKTVYGQIVDLQHSDEYYNQQVIHSYFYGLLLAGELRYDDLCEYLAKKGNFILNYNADSIVPWLTLLLQIKRLKTFSNDQIGSLDVYIARFSELIDENQLRFVKDKTLVNKNTLKEQLIQSLLGHGESRYPEDRAAEKFQIYPLASNYLRDSILERDPEGALLALYALADSSTNLSSYGHENSLRIPILFADDAGVVKKTHLNNFGNYINNLLPVGYPATILWLFESGGNIHYVELSNSTFVGPVLIEKWTALTMREWVQNKLPGFGFDINSITEFGEINENKVGNICNETRAGLSFAVLPVEIETQAVVVPSYELVEFPHNLLIDKKGEYISEKVPITSVSDIAMLSKNATTKLEDSENIINAWIPYKNGDYTIAYVFSRLEDVLMKIGANVIMTNTVEGQIEHSRINMFVGHGKVAEDGFVGVYASDSIAWKSLENTLPPSELAILFICHSGNQTSAKLVRKIESLTNRLLDAGYFTVVAPG